FAITTLNGTRSILNIHFATTELFKTATRSRNSDRHANLSFLGALKFFSHGFRDRVDRARTIDFDHRGRMNRAKPRRKNSNKKGHDAPPKMVAILYQNQAN